MRLIRLLTSKKMGESWLERIAACIVTLFVHLLVAFCLLRAARQELADPGNRNGKSDQVLFVTSVDLAPSLERTQERMQMPVQPSATENPTRETPTDSRNDQSNPNDEASMPIEVDDSLAETRPNEQQDSTFTQGLTEDAAMSTSMQGVQSNDLLSGYQAALRAAIRDKWASLTAQPLPLGCSLKLTQTTGGIVIEASTVNCNLAEVDRLRLEVAALLAQPLPYAGYESVFSPEMLLSF